MSDGSSIDWEDELFGDDASEVSDTESDDDQVIFIIYTICTYVILHVRNATLNQRARGQTDARARRKGAIVLLVADASLRLARVKIDQERQQYMEGPRAARAPVG